MASPSSSGSISCLAQSSGSEENLQALMDQRKRKRMVSNRESARRSRMRKQKHLDDLTAQVSQLKMENHQIMTRVSVTSQHFVSVEDENCVLRAQMNELSHRLQSLEEITNFLNMNTGPGSGSGSDFSEPIDSFFVNPLSLSYLNHPIMASADTFQY